MRCGDRRCRLEAITPQTLSFLVLLPFTAWAATLAFMALPLVYMGVELT